MDFGAQSVILSTSIQTTDKDRFMMAFKQKILISSLVLFCFGVPTLSAYADANKIQELRSIFENMIADAKAQSNDSATVIYKGDLNIEDAGSYYAVTMPHSSVEIDQTTVDIGIFAINASPHTKEGQWKMSIATPTPIFIRDTEKARTAQIHIGAQKAAGLWNSAAKAFLKFNGTYSDIRIEDSANLIAATIPEVQVSKNIEMTDSGIMTGTGAYGLSNAQFNITNKKDQSKSTVTIENAAVKVDMRGLNRAGLQDIREKILSKDAKFSPTPQEISTLLAELFTYLGDGMTTTYSLKNIETKDSVTPNLIRTAALGVDIRGFAEDKASTRFFTNFDAEKTLSKDSLAPSFMNFDIQFKDLPIKQITSITANSLKNSAESNSSGLAMMNLMIKVPMLLGQNGSRLTFAQNKIGNDLYEVHLDGEIRADINALKNAVGTLDLAVHGYDNLRREADRIAESKPQQAQKILSQIAMLERYIPYAKISTDAKGRALHQFKIKLDEQGIITINGQDISKAPNDITVEPSQ